MKKFTVLLVIFVLFSYILNGENKITIFEGGTHTMNLEFHSSMLSGVTSKSMAMGNTISSVSDDPSLVVLNPAALSRNPVTSFCVDMSPGFSIDLNKLTPAIKDGMNDAIDASIKDMKTPTSRVTYPDLKCYAGQSGWFNTFAATYNARKYGSFGILLHRPLFCDFEYLGNALNVNIQDSVLKDVGEATEHTEKTVLPLSIDLFSKLTINLNQIDIAYSRQINPRINAGIGLEVIHSEINSDINARFAGSIRQFGGDTDINVSFDDPNVAYRNTLNDSLYARFNKNIAGFKFAMSYHKTDSLLFDLVITTPKKADLDGSMILVQHTLGALNMNYNKALGEEIFDVEMLKPSQIAYTNRTIYTSNKLQLSYPGSIALCASFVRPSKKFILSYELPLGDLALKYACTRITDGVKKDTLTNNFYAFTDTTYKKYTIGFRNKHVFKMAFAYKKLWLSTQIFVSDIIAEGVKNKNGTEMKNIKKNNITPSFAVGYSYVVLKNIVLDLNYLAFPNPFFRTTLTYKL